MITIEKISTSSNGKTFSGILWQECLQFRKVPIQSAQRQLETNITAGAARANMYLTHILR